MSKQIEEDLDDITKKILHIGGMVESAIDRALISLLDRDRETAVEVIRGDDVVDNLENEVEEKCLAVLSLRAPVARDLRYICGMMKINSDLERMGDLAVNIAERAEVLAEQLAKSGRPVTPELEAQIKEEVINREIFMQEAVRRGLDASDEYKNQLELARQSILIRELFNDQQNKDKVTDADIKAEYDKFVAANGGKEYRARHILVEKEDQAKAIVASLKKGAKFEDLAKKQSKDPGSGANGGDLDWAAGGNYVKEFSEAMVALKKGQLTDKPVKTQFGWHVIRLDDVREALLPKFDEVKPQISQQMLQTKMGQFQQDLRAKAKIE